MAQTINNSPVMRETWRPGFDPWVGKILWRKEWRPTPVFLPGESHGQRSLVGYNPRGCKESDTTERLTHTLPFLRFPVSNLEHSLEGLMLKLKLKLQYFGHLMQRVDSLEKTQMLGGIGGRKSPWKRA